MNPDKTTQLIERSKQNDTEAFRELVAEYQPFVFRLGFRLLCDEDEAKDIVQDTFVKVWLNLYKYKNQFRFSTWICKIACNLCYDRLRAKKHLQNNIEISEQISGENIELSIINKELGELIIGMTRYLSPKQKLVFTLRDIECLEIDDIKVITGLSAEKIKSNLYLARQYIRNRINEITKFYYEKE